MGDLDQYLKSLSPEDLAYLKAAMANTNGFAQRLPVLNGMASGINYTSPANLAPKTQFGTQASSFLDKLRGIDANTVGGYLQAFTGATEVIGDAMNSAKGTFTKEKAAEFDKDQNAQLGAFTDRASKAYTTDDILGLSSNVPDFATNADSIKTQEYNFGKTLGNIGKGAAAGAALGSVVPVIGTAIGAIGGAIFGGAADLIGQGVGSAEDQIRKEKAQNKVITLDNAIARNINSANKKVSNVIYNQNMANYLNNAAFGGPLETHGSDFTDDLIRIDAGGSHEQNPFGGVPAGVDPQGIPNLVEEGEIIWDKDDYVFSDRLKMPKDLMKKYDLGGKKDKPITYSEGVDKISKKLQTELRPNDPITKRTKDAILSEMEESQEEKRMEMKQREIMKAISQMSPEELAALVQPQEQVPVEPMVSPQGVVEEQPMVEEPVGMAAFGGPIILDGEHETSRKKPAWGGVRPKLMRWGMVSPYMAYGYSEKDSDGTLHYYGPEGVRIEVRDDGTFTPGSVIGDKYSIPETSTGRPLYQLIGRDAIMDTYPEYDDGMTGTYIRSGFVQPVIPHRAKRYYDFPAVTSSGQEATATSTKAKGTGAGKKKTSAAFVPDSNDFLNLDAWANAVLAQDNKVPEMSPVTMKEDNLKADKMKVPDNSKLYPTWMRYAPIFGSALSVLSDTFSQPDYGLYDGLISSSRRLSNPVSIGVRTIGDRVRRNPFDERLMVNQANQNLAAGLRSTMDTAGGNRAYRQFANNLMAYNNQAQLADIARNAYLANRQDALQAADFNRQTNMFNAQAINQRNLTEARLNSDREYYGQYALANALNAYENAKRYDDSLVAADFTGLMQNLGNLGRENFDFNRLEALRREGLDRLGYNGRNGNMTFNPDGSVTIGACGGKKKTKKRRF